MNFQTPVAVRYLGLVPTVAGFDRNLTRELSGARIRGISKSAGGGIGNHIVSGMTKTLKVGALAAGGAVAGILGTSIYKGFERLTSIENAEAKLRGLGNSAEATSKVMDNALASVKGTAFGMDEAATTAASAVAAGVKPGKELESYLRQVGDAATIAGTDMGSMGSIFNKVATSGKVQGDVFAQLGDMGIPIVQLLAEELGVSAEQVYKMGSAGEISSEQFLAAMSTMDGAALESGKTTTGALKNVSAALARFGATLLKGVYPMVGLIARRFTELIDVVQEKVDPIITALMDRFGGGATDGINEFFDVLIRGVSAVEPEPIINFFDRVGAVAGPIMDQVAAALRGVWDALKGADYSSFSAFIDSLAGSDVGSAFSGLGSGLGDIAKSSPGVLAVGLKAIGGAMEFIGEHQDLIVKLLPYLVAGFIAYKVAVQGVTAATTAQRSMDLATLPVQIARNVTSYAAAKARLAATVAEIGQTNATKATRLATIQATIAERTRTAVTKAGALATAIGTKAMVFAKVAAKGLWRALMGPIGWIIAGVALLTAGLVWFFTKTEIGQQLWAKIWGWIKNAAAAVVSWFMDTALPLLSAAWDGIVAGAMWVYENGIRPAWAGIRTAVAATIDWIVNTAWPALKIAWSAIAAAAVWLYQNVIKPVWTGIKIAIAVVVTAVLLYIDLWVWYVKNILAPVAIWLYRNVILPVWGAIKTAIAATIDWMVNVGWPILKAVWNAVAASARWLYNNVILPVWNAIRSAISAVVGWMVNVGWPILKAAWDAIAAAARWLYNSVIKPVWTAIKAAISAVVAWLRDVAWPIVNTVIGWLRGKFENFKLGLRIIWGFIKNNIIGPVVAWFRDVVWPIISRVLGYIKTGFGLFKEGLRVIWDAVRNRIIAPVVNWFRDTVKPIFDRVTGGIKSSFDTMQKGVKKAWEKVKETAKAPVKFVVEKIVRDGIVKKYNEVAGTFGVPKIDTKKFTVGWSSGGYTGPGAKYAPAGVVHADEYVIRKESQNSLRRAAPGLLDDLNRRGAAALEGRLAGYAKGGWVKPFRGNFSQNSPYGMRNGRLHAGVDYPTPSGTALVAVSDGSVARTSTSGPAGNRVAMNTSIPGIVAQYHHMSRMLVRVGQAVKQGQLVGYSGNTGRSTGPHLHFSVKRNGKYVNPNPYLQGAGAAGTDDGGGFFNPFDGLWDSLKSKIRDGVGDSAFGDALFNMPKEMIDGAMSWATKKLSELGDFAQDTVDTGKGAARWTPVATQALMMEGEFSPSNLASLLRRMNQESGYNPLAKNNWDSNAKRGTPSKGLMQVIDPTFRAYARPGYNKDIWDPLSNILASIRYARARYGNPAKGWNRKGGYADGGHVTPILHDSGGRLEPGISVIANKTRRPETILPPAESDALMRLAKRGGGDEPPTVVFQNTIHAEPNTAKELVSELMWEQKLAERKHRGRYAQAGR